MLLRTLRDSTEANNISDIVDNLSISPWSTYILFRWMAHTDDVLFHVEPRQCDWVIMACRHIFCSDSLKNHFFKFYLSAVNSLKAIMAPMAENSAVCKKVFQLVPTYLALKCCFAPYDGQETAGRTFD